MTEASAAIPVRRCGSPASLKPLKIHEETIFKAFRDRSDSDHHHIGYYC